jgi:hypothetical protein
VQPGVAALIRQDEHVRLGVVAPRLELGPDVVDLVLRTEWPAEVFLRLQPVLIA